MRLSRSATALVLCLPLLLAILLMGACGGDDPPPEPSEPASGALDLGPVADEPVAYAQVQTLFDRNCVACHPAVNASLDLTAGNSYAEVVGAQALEAPDLVRVVAGDPDSSFLYLKVAGFAGLGDIPAYGTRMPPSAPRLPADEIRILRDWIAQGAKNEDGETVSAGAVATAGSLPQFTGAPSAAVERGTGTLVGRVIDAQRTPLAGAIVTLLLKGEDLPGGEEHVRAAITGPDGRYRLPEVPEGRIELKAYAPNTIYVSQVLEVVADGTATADFGLPDRIVDNPRISRPAVTTAGATTRLALTLDGTSLDRNYTVAVNVAAGRVFELRALTDAEGEPRPGEWTRELTDAPGGEWIFLAVDETCNVSEFLRVSS